MLNRILFILSSILFCVTTNIYAQTDVQAEFELNGAVVSVVNLCNDNSRVVTGNWIGDGSFPAGDVNNYNWSVTRDSDGTVVAASDGPDKREPAFNVEPTDVARETYTVSLTVTNSGGQSFTMTKTGIIKLHPNPQFDFTADQQGCEPFEVCPVVVPDPNNNPINEYNWNFNGAAATGENACFTFDVAGTYFINLELVDTAGCKNRVDKDDFIEVLETPQATMNVPAGTDYCEITGPVSFVGGPNGADTYEWYIGAIDGTPDATDQNPDLNIPAADGAYTIALISTNANGCADTLINVDYINVGAPAVGFTVDRAVGCIQPATNFVFTDTTSGAQTSMWDFGDGTTGNGAVVSHTYAAVGTYTVTLTSDNGDCSGTSTFDVQVVEPTVAINAPDKICSNPATGTFAATGLNGPVANYVWNFGGGNATNPNDSVTDATFPVSGSYNISLMVTDTNGCTQTSDATVEVNALDVQLSVDTPQGCAPLTNEISVVNPGFQDINDVDQIIFDFGNGDTETVNNPNSIPVTASTTYTDRGEFTGTVTIISNSENCQTEEPFEVKTGDKPVITDLFPQNGMDTICVSDTLVMEATLVDPDSIDVIEFYFQDVDAFQAGDAEERTFQKFFSETDSIGDYQVRVVAKDRECVSDTFDHVIPGDSTFVTVFGPSSEIDIIEDSFNCSLPFVRHFNDTSVDDSIKPGFGSIDTRLWEFGDGTTSTLKSPSHTFPEAGNYFVKLTVCDTFSWNGQECCNTDSIEVIVRDPSAIALTFDLDTTAPSLEYLLPDDTTIRRQARGCVPITAVLDLNETVSDTSNITYRWIPTGDENDFEETTTSTSYSYLYPETPGDVSDTFRPAVELTSILEGGLTCTVRTDSIFSDSIVPGTEPQIQLEIAEYESQIVELLPLDTTGCDDFTVEFQAVVNVSAATYTNQITWVLDDTAVLDFEFRTERPLVGSDLGVDTLVFEHTFTNRGSYEIDLFVVDTFGCTDTTIVAAGEVGPATVKISKPDNVVSAPDFAKYDTLIAVSAVNQPFIDSFVWFIESNSIDSSMAFAFGTDQDTIFIQSPERDTFNIVSIIYDTTGCTDTAFKQVVFDEPIVDFEKQVISKNDLNPIQVEFTPIVDSLDTVVSYEWIVFDNGDTTFSNNENFAYDFTRTGTYRVCLIVNLASGGVDTTCYDDAVVINGAFAEEYEVVFFGPPCLPLEVEARVSGSTGVAGYSWSFDGQAGSVFPDSFITFTYTECGDYNIPAPILIPSDTNSEGFAIDGLEGPNHIATISIPCIMPGFELPMDSCVPTYVSPLNLATSSNATIATVEYDFEFHEMNVQAPNPAAKPTPVLHDKPGTWSVTQTVTTDEGCTATAVDSIVQFPAPEVSIFGQEEVRYCFGTSVQFEATEDSNYTYYWTPSTGMDDPNIRTPTVSNTEDATYTVSVINEFGCIGRSSDSISTTVHQPFEVTAQFDTVIDVNTKARIEAFTDGVNQGRTVFRWEPAESVDCPSCPVTTVKPFETTTYTVFVSDENQCDTVTAQVTVEVIDEIIFEMPEAFTPNGDGVNDILPIQGLRLDRTKEISFVIYNRWGEKVFETTDVEEGWNGRYNGNGEVMAADTYFYKITVIGFNEDNTREYEGRVTIIK